VVLGLAIAAVGVGTIVLLTRAQLGGARPSPAATSRSSSPSVARSVAWAALPDTGTFPSFPPDTAPSPPVPIPPGTPSCAANQVEGRAYDGARLPGGVVVHDVLLRDRGGSDCTLDGFPGLMVLDGAGFPLAKLTGSDAPPADLPSVPSVAVLLTAGTPQLPAVTAGPGDNTTAGQARMEVEWAGCKPTRASQLALFLATDSRQLTIAFPFVASPTAACGPQGIATAATVARGPFTPTGVQWPPLPKYISLSIDASVSASVRRGSMLMYAVTLTNTGRLDYALDPCPHYTEIVGAKAAVASFQLNCSAAGDIAPGASVTFQMELDIPATAPLGPTTLDWALDDGRVTQPYVSAPITVIG
jgi:hypothetical protein